VHQVCRSSPQKVKSDLGQFSGLTSHAQKKRKG
jgi:hypothetical protein